MIPGRPAQGTPLAGRSVLVLEDDFLIADEVCALIGTLGGEVLGPASSSAAALRLLGQRSPDVALLDVNLHGERAYDVAEALAGAGVPFAFTTGYDLELIDARFAYAPHLEKPFTAKALVRVLEALLQSAD
jgi:CheY-like chemotaxis protein